MNSWIKAIVLSVLAATAGCSGHASKQDPDKAAASAIAFARAALVERDMDKAYSLLDPEVQSNAPKEKFVEVAMSIVADISPTLVTATEFEPIPGQEMMNIYLTGEKGAEKIFYRIPMRGNAEKGYKAVGILRGQYAPSQSRQPLQVKPSTGG
jgi:hypothetical protein